MKKLKLINKYANEDSIKMVSPGTLSTPEQAGVGKGFWHVFYFIFYSLQSLSGNLKKEDNNDNKTHS